MAKVLSLVRTLLLAVAIWQVLGIVSASMEFMKPEASQFALGRLAVFIMLKLTVGGVALLMFAIVGKTVRRRAALMAATGDTGASSNATGATRTVNRATALFALATATVGYFSYSALQDRLNKDAPEKMMGMASQCTSRMAALTQHYPNLAGYTPDEITEQLVKSSGAFVTDESRRATRTYLSECKWNLVLSRSGENLYLRPDTVRVLPGMRRTAAVLFDYSAPQEIDSRGAKHTLQSMLAFAVTDCSNGAVQYTSIRGMSDYFAAGQIVVADSDDVNPSEAALIPVRDGSAGAAFSKAICRI